MSDEAPPADGKDAYTRDRMREIANLVDDLLPAEWGFVILAFPFNKPGRVNYVSNAKPDSVIEVMKDFIKRKESGKDLWKHHHT